MREPCSAAMCVTVFPLSSCSHDNWFFSSVYRHRLPFSTINRQQVHIKHC